MFAARLDHAIDLYRAGVAKHLVVTGGKADGDRVTEGAAARAYLTARGVPDDAILGGDDSRTTLASVRAVAGVLRDHDLGTAVFVSDPTHMLRVLRMARDAGIDGHGSPTRTSPVDRDPSAGGRRRARGRRLAVYFVTGDVRAAPGGQDPFPEAPIAASPNSATSLRRLARNLASYTVPKPHPSGTAQCPPIGVETLPAQPPVPSA